MMAIRYAIRYIEEDKWRIIGPMQTGAFAYNPGGEVALWTSVDQGATWQMTHQLTANSPMNHTFVRRPVNAHPDFYALWADGNPREPAPSRLYFTNWACDAVWQLPTTMQDEFVTAQVIQLPVCFASDKKERMHTASNWSGG